jgi:hypothetical protein
LICCDTAFLVLSPLARALSKGSGYSLPFRSPFSSYDVWCRRHQGAHFGGSGSDSCDCGGAPLFV